MAFDLHRSSGLALPDQRPVPKDLPHPVQWYGVCRPVPVNNLKRKTVARRLDDLVKGYTDNLLLYPVEIAYLKGAATKFPVPADEAQ